jgi:hypothetical protein
MNGIVFLISFCAWSLLIYRKATDTYMLIFCVHPATLPKVFIISKSFLVEYLGPLKYRILSPASRDNMTSSFPVCVPFFLSLALLFWLGIQATILNKSGERGHPCPIPNFRGNGFPHLV